MYDKARGMDTADRFLNAKSVIYQIRAGNFDYARKLIGLFVKDAEDPETNLQEMQCCYYFQQLSEAHLIRGTYSLALKNAAKIEEYFKIAFNDQFDFHSYSIRKQTIRSYIATINFEDSIYSHKNYVNAAKQTIATYLYMVQFGKEKEKLSSDEIAMEKMNEEEKKKFLRKKKKEQLIAADKEKKKSRL